MSEINTYQKENPIFSLNGVDVDPKFKDGEVWLSEAQIAKLFCKNRSTANRHLKELEKRLEKHVSAKCAFFAQTVQNSSSGNQIVKYYNIDYIIRIGYMFNGEVAEAFQDWATSTLKREIHEQANPHLILERGIDTLKDKGESDEKIKCRVEGKLARRAFTHELSARGQKKHIGYHTNKTYVGMTGSTAQGLKEVLSIDKHESLRDNMTATELAAVKLSEMLAVDKIVSIDAKTKKDCSSCCLDAGKEMASVWGSIQKTKRNS